MVPAALLTGYATKETADEAASRGIGVMFKPIEIEEFLATTSNMLRRNNEPKQEGGEKGNRGPQNCPPRLNRPWPLLDLAPPPVPVRRPRRPGADSSRKAATFMA